MDDFFEKLFFLNSSYIRIDLYKFAKKNSTKAKRSVTWPLYGLFGLENTLIINDVEKKWFIPNFNQIRLVVPKLFTKLEITQF